MKYKKNDAVIYEGKIWKIKRYLNDEICEIYLKEGHTETFVLVHENLLKFAQFGGKLNYNPFIENSDGTKKTRYSPSVIRNKELWELIEKLEKDLSDVKLEILKIELKEIAKRVEQIFK